MFLLLWICAFWTFTCLVDSQDSVRQEGVDKVLPWLGMGTAGLRQETSHLVLLALQQGVRLIDTAQAKEWYDERSVASAVSTFLAEEKVSDELVIVTKIHPRSYRLQPMSDALAISAQNFGSKNIDVVLLHAPVCWRGHCSKEEQSVGWGEAWRNLENLKDRFNISMIGVSNFHIDEVRELVLEIANRKVSVIQNWMDPFHQDREVREFCRAHGIQYMAYSSFGTQWEFARNGENPVFTNPLLQFIADKYDTTISSVVLSWLKHENVVAIPRSSSPSHIVDNFRICTHSNTCSDGSIKESEIVLDESDIKELRNLDGILGTPWD